MKANDELGELRRLWHEAAPPGSEVAALRRLVDAQTRNHAWIVGSVAAANVVVLGWALWRAIGEQSAHGWVSLAFVVLYSGVAWALTLWLSRGQRAPRDESTAAYLDVAIRRCRANVIGAPLGIGLLVAGLALAVWIRTALLGQEPGVALRSGPVHVTAGIVLPLYALFMVANAVVHYRRLQRLRALQQALLAA